MRNHNFAAKIVSLNEAQLRAVESRRSFLDDAKISPFVKRNAPTVSVGFNPAASFTKHFERKRHIGRKPARHPEKLAHGITSDHDPGPGIMNDIG